MSDVDALPREEFLKSTAGLRGPRAMSAWRGVSGRRYVVGIFDVREIEPDDLTEAVVIAVRRDGTGNSNGIAQPVRVTLCHDVATARAFLAVLPKAVTEIHLHRTEPNAANRARIVEDLSRE